MATNGSRFSTDGLLERYPALLRLGIGTGRIPFIPQLAPAECGAACLAMVLSFHGSATRLDEIRDVMKVGRDGSTALAILHAADWFHLHGRGIRIDLEDLEYLERGSILHWNMNHFVVFDRLTSTGVRIVDPAVGHRTVSMERFAKAFTGVALTLQPKETFKKGGRQAPSFALRKQILRAVFESGTVFRLVVLSVMGHVLMMAMPALTIAVVDRVVPHADYGLMTLLAIELSVVILFFALSTATRTHLLVRLGAIVDTRMSLAFIDHLFQLPYAYFQQRTNGDLLMRMNAVTQIREMLSNALLSGIVDSAFVVIYLVVLAIASPSMALLVLGIGVLQSLALMMIRKRQHELMQESFHQQARAQSQQMEILVGIETLKALGCEQQATEQWSDNFVDVANVNLRKGHLMATNSAFTAALRLGAPIIILFYGANAVLAGSMSLGTMLGVSSLAHAVLGPFNSLVFMGMQMQMLRTNVDRVKDVVDANPEQDQERVHVAPEVRGSIEIQNVRFRYNRATPFVLDDVSLTIDPGDFVAIVGTSGSGKSTLAALLIGMYRPEEGQITYDGQSIYEMDLRSLRRQLGIVVQRPHLFQGTIRKNIALLDPTTDMDTIVRAAKVAEIHQDIRRMPMGYDTMILGGGNSLSGGQRQRIALARALVRNPKVLLLDEATSALDSITEARVHDNLQSLTCTRIVIAHRLSTILGANKIVVMQHGRIAGCGTHEDLLATNEHYRQLFRLYSPLNLCEKCKKNLCEECSATVVPDAPESARQLSGAVLESRPALSGPRAPSLP